MLRKIHSECFLEIVNRFGDFYENTRATTDGGSDWQDENENRSRFSSMMISSVGEDLQNRRRMEVFRTISKLAKQ